MNDLEYYRIREAGLSFDASSRSTYSVTVVLGQSACTTVIGQNIALNLLNIVLRFVNNIVVVVPSEGMPLLTRFPFGDTDLLSTIKKVADVCDPRARVEVIAACPIENGKVRGNYSIGIGADVDKNCDLYLSAKGYVGTSGRTPLSLDANESVLVGAGVSALLGASNIARNINGQEALVTSISAWNYREGALVDTGPGIWTPLDIGKARIVGAGAVASALVYWLYQWGEKSSWEIVDADVVKLKNISKTIAYSTKDSLELSGIPVKKVDALKPFLRNVSTFDSWYDEWDVRQGQQPDVVIPLANERGVRARIASDSNTVVLHGTTSTDWESFVHRHIAGLDDCIACRLPDKNPIAMACSTGAFGKTTENQPGRDSSLPFVGGASGLMLAVMLKRLEDGKLKDLERNGYAWQWRTEHGLVRTSKYKCETGCHTFLPPAIRRAVNSTGRWANLDVDS